MARRWSRFTDAARGRCFHRFSHCNGYACRDLFTPLMSPLSAGRSQLKWRSPKWTQNGRRRSALWRDVARPTIRSSVNLLLHICPSPDGGFHPKMRAFKGSTSAVKGCMNRINREANRLSAEIFRYFRAWHGHQVKIVKVCNLRACAIGGKRKQYNHA